MSFVYGGGSGGGGSWGSITGTLANQTDLQTALDAKAPLASPIFTGTIGTPLTASKVVLTDVAGALSAGTPSIAQGGTGQTSAGAAFNALSPMTTAGDIIYGGASGAGTRLAVGSNGQYLKVAAGIPSWATLVAGDFSGPASNTYSGGIVVFSGTGGKTGADTYSKLYADLDEAGNHSIAFGEYVLTVSGDRNLHYGCPQGTSTLSGTGNAIFGNMGGSTSGTNNLLGGRYAPPVTGSNNTIWGNTACFHFADVTGNYNTGSGFSVFEKLTSGGYNSEFGASHRDGTTGITTGESNLHLGYGAAATMESNSQSNTGIVGGYISGKGYLNDIFFGRGHRLASANLGTIKLQPTGAAAGTDQDASASVMVIAGSTGTGTGRGGQVKIQNAPAGSTGTTRGTLYDNVAFDVGRVATSDATVTTVFSQTLADDTVYFFSAVVKAHGDAANKRAIYQIKGAFYREDAGGATQQGSTVVAFSEETDAGMDCVFDTSSNDVRIRVTGIAATAFNWQADVQIYAMQ